MATKKGEKTKLRRGIATRWKFNITPVRTLALLALVCFVSAAPSCPSKNKAREARKAAYRIQVVTDAATDTTITLYDDGVIDRGKARQIAGALQKINNANGVLIQKAKLITKDDASSVSAVIAQVRIVADAVKELKALGVLGIKSKAGGLAFESAVNALDTSLAIIESTLGVKP